MKKLLLLLTTTILVINSCTDDTPVELESSSGKIIFRSATTHGYYTGEFYSMNPDGTNRNLIRLIPELRIHDTWYSPDGKKVLMTGTLENGKIYIMNTDGTNFRLIGENAWSSPAWSPDSKRVAYIANEYNNTLFIINHDGTEERIVTKDTLSWNVAWLDNETLVYSVDTVGILSIKADGSNRKIVKAKGGDYTPNIDLSYDNRSFTNGLRVSPDGTMISFQVNRNDVERKALVMKSDGSDSRVLTSGKYTSTYEWSPDSKRGIIATLKWNHVPGLFTINADGTSFKELSPNSIINPKWSPDGKHIIYRSTAMINDSTFESTTMIMDTEGNNIRNLTPVGQEDFDPIWVK